MMKKLKILSVYKWATMGGVERVLLNRAHVLQEHGFDIIYDVMFLHDSGGKKNFLSYVKTHGLDSILRVVDDVNHEDYDYILPIDTPEIIKLVDPKKVYMECHTPYENNRGYLKQLPSDIRGILVPSQHFKEHIYNEVSKNLQDKLEVLSNTVYIEKSGVEKQKIYSKLPVAYIGRIDILKNVEEVVKVVSLYNKTYNDQLFVILAGTIIEHEVDLNKILKKYNMVNRTIYLPSVNFDKVWDLLQFLSFEKGIFMSASLGESFGLSVAEAMAMGLPSLLLKHKAHQVLVNEDSRYLFDAGNNSEAVQKLNALVQNYEENSEMMLSYSKRINQQFIDQFKQTFM